TVHGRIQPGVSKRDARQKRRASTEPGEHCVERFEAEPVGNAEPTTVCARDEIRDPSRDAVSIERQYGLPVRLWIGAQRTDLQGESAIMSAQHSVERRRSISPAPSAPTGCSTAPQRCSLPCRTSCAAWTATSTSASASRK